MLYVDILHVGILHVCIQDILHVYIDILHVNVLTLTYCMSAHYMFALTYTTCWHIALNEAGEQGFNTAMAMDTMAGHGVPH